MSRLAVRLISFAAVALIAYVVYRVAGDAPAGSFGLRRPWLLCLVLPLAVLNHALRWARWHILLRAVASRPVRPVDTAHSFLMGSLAIFTPARAGEVLKAAVAFRLAAVPVGCSVAVLAVERSMDIALMAMLLLPGYQSIPAVGTGHAVRGGILAAAALAVIGTAALPWFIGRLPRRFAGIVGSREEAVHALRSLTKPGNILPGVLMGAVAWATEALIYAIALVSAGADWNGGMLAVAFTIWAASSLAGALSMLPAGLGVTEGSLMALGVSYGHLDFSTAATAAVLARGAVFGTIILFGLPSLWVWEHHKVTAR